MKWNVEIGKWGEKVAEQFLINNHCTIINKNYRTPYGEIDIIAEDNDEMIMVEVKTRSSLSYGFPEEAITNNKIRHLTESAEYYLQSEKYKSEIYRIDIISVIGRPGKTNPEIKWYKNAITEY